MVIKLPGLRPEALARHRAGDGAPRGVVLERDAEGRPTRERVTLTHVPGDGGGQALRHDGARIPLTAEECADTRVGDAVEIAPGVVPGRVPSKQRMSAWEAKRQAEQVDNAVEGLICELERSEPPRDPTSGQVLHEVVLRSMLPHGCRSWDSRRTGDCSCRRVPTQPLTPYFF